jgi:hypothetical protein
VINTIALAATVLTMTGSLFLALGKLKAVYTLGLVNGLCYVALNVLLAFQDGQQWVALLAVPSAWGTVMSAVGLYRIRRKS